MCGYSVDSRNEGSGGEGVAEKGVSPPPVSPYHRVGGTPPDPLTGMHANTHLPLVVGAVRAEAQVDCVCV